MAQPEYIKTEGNTQSVTHNYGGGVTVDIAVYNSNGNPQRMVITNKKNGVPESVMTVADTGLISMKEGNKPTVDHTSPKEAQAVLNDWKRLRGDHAMYGPEFARLESSVNAALGKLTANEVAVANRAAQMEAALKNAGVCKTDFCKPLQVADASHNGRATTQRAEGHGQGVGGRQ